MSASETVTPHALQPNYGASMGADDASKVAGVDKCYTYISRCGVHSSCGTTVGDNNDWQYIQPSHCGGLHIPPKVEHHCSRVCDNTCPSIGGFVPDIDDRKFVAMGSRWAQCPYTLGNIKTEDDMTTWVTKFPNSDANNATVYGTKVIPYYCGIDNNIIAGTGSNGSAGACQTFCHGQWNSNPQCAAALQSFCAKGDNALNNDLCFSACNTPAADGKPTWCDTVITSVCALVDGQPMAFTIESFMGSTTNIISLLVVIAVVAALYYASGMTKIILL